MTVAIDKPNCLYCSFHCSP